MMISWMVCLLMRLMLCQAVLPQSLNLSRVNLLGPQCRYLPLQGMHSGINSCSIGSLRVSHWSARTAEVTSAAKLAGADVSGFLA